MVFDIVSKINGFLLINPVVIDQWPFIYGVFDKSRALNDFVCNKSDLPFKVKY